MQLMSGTEIYTRAIELLVKPDVNYVELERCFNDFALLLNHSVMENDENLSNLWFQIGCVSNKRGHFAVALQNFKTALEHKPDFLEAMNNLGYVYKQMNFSEEANHYFKKVLDLAESGTVQVTPKSRSEFYVNHGSMFVANGTPDKAIELFDRAESICDEQKMIRYNRGLAYLEKGDYERGFKGYNQGDRHEKVINRNYGHEKLPFWDGTPGKNIVIIGEQGLGDELLFATILPDVAATNPIVFDAHPRLANMFRRSFPHLDVYGTRKDGTTNWGKRYPLDAKILIGSLAEFYRKKESDFKPLHYLQVDPKMDHEYSERLLKLGDKPKIGISWRGGTKQTGRSNRYISFDKWLPIIKMPFDFISLQYDPGILEEVEKFNKENGVQIHHWPETMEDYEQTAALVKNLDLIISVPQSVVHLSGVIGTTPTWQLTPFKSLWQSGVHGKNMPWYDNVENIWQDSSCDWNPVIETVRERLCNL